MGRFLHECQKDISLLMVTDKFSSCAVFSLFSEEDNLIATDRQYGFETFSRHCVGLLSNNVASSVPVKHLAVKPTFLNPVNLKDT